VLLISKKKISEEEMKVYAVKFLPELWKVIYGELMDLAEKEIEKSIYIKTNGWEERVKLLRGIADRIKRQCLKQGMNW